MAPTTLPSTKYKCSQAVLYAAGTLLTGNLTTKQADFTAYKGKYTAAFTTALIGKLNAAKALPDDSSRSAVPESLRLELEPLREVCTDKWQDLKSYIEEIYKKASKPKLEAAGSKFYSQAIRNNWEYAVTMNDDAIAFMTANQTELEAAGMNMPTTFIMDYKAAALAFKNKYDEFEAARQTTAGAATKINANNDLYSDLIGVSDDGKKIFKKQPDMAKQFTWSTLVTMIAPHGAAGLRLTVVEEGTFTPVVGAQVSIQRSGNPPLKAVTDAGGVTGFESIEPASYKVLVQHPDYLDYTATKKVDDGTDARLDVQMKRKP